MLIGPLNNWTFNDIGYITSPSQFTAVSSQMVGTDDLLVLFVAPNDLSHLLKITVSYFLGVPIFRLVMY
jgi:hypothetical protein